MAKTIPPPPSKPKPVLWEDYAIGEVLAQRRKGPPHPAIPQINDKYVLRDGLVAELAYAAFPPDGVRPLPLGFLGPKGCGKTSLILQVAARCRVPCYRINLNVGTSVRHLKGHRGAKPGRTVHYEGIAARAMAEGVWLILDELSGATPPVALSLFPILEHDGAVLLEDAEPPRYVERHPDFRVFATDNAIGAGQEDTRFSYGGTSPDLNEALLDRFGGFVEVGYLPALEEFKAVAAEVPTVDPNQLEIIIRLINHLRNSTIDYGFSTRMAINWAQRVAYGYPRVNRRPLEDHEMLGAARVAFLNGMRSKVDRDAAEEIIVRMVGGGHGHGG